MKISNGTRTDWLPPSDPDFFERKLDDVSLCHYVNLRADCELGWHQVLLQYMGLDLVAPCSYAR